MNKTLIFKGLLMSLLFITTFGTISAQIQFKLELLEDGETYMVSLVSDKTWKHPHNITSTAQVTLTVPTQAFEVKNLTSLQLGIEWSDNSRSEAPAEAPGLDYISFGLASMGTVKLNYVAGEEMPLFTFQNALPCQGEVALMNNADDPFKSPNSRSANVGNSITVFGSRGEAYMGNMENFTTVPCSSDLSTSVKEEDLISSPKVYPNPARNELFIDMTWKDKATEGDFVIMDATGKEVKRQTISIEKGFNKVPLEVKNLSVGLYSIEVQSNGKSQAISRFVKAGR
jgi:hypothetical protein